VCVVCLFETKVANEGREESTLIFWFIHALFADSLWRDVEPEDIPAVFSTLTLIYALFPDGGRWYVA